MIVGVVLSEATDPRRVHPGILVSKQAHAVFLGLSQNPVRGLTEENKGCSFVHFQSFVRTLKISVFVPG